MEEVLFEARSKEGIAARLSLTREALGFDQREFAERAGLKANAYNQYEKAKNFPSLDAAHALCDTYKLTLDWIFRGEPSGLRYETGAAIDAMRRLRQAT